VKVYHRTYAAEAILREGFIDSSGYYMTRNLYSGAWFSNEPLDINEGATGDSLLCLDIPESTFVDYEWVEEGRSFREALIPADIVNQYGPPTLVAEE
jgi:hypothetical protein